MKIGVLTYHCPPNFGAQLQALSTIGYLRRMGHEPVMLNWYAEDLEKMYSRRIPAQQVACHNSFAEQYLPLSAKCQKEEELIAEIDRLCLDGIVAGSDALFHYIPFRNRSRFSRRHLRFYPTFQPLSCELLAGNPFFGEFLAELKNRVPASVYAVSSQNCPYKLMTCKERKQMSRMLANYRQISVRDEWTRQMMSRITGRKDVNIYPDPVFSFNQNCASFIPSREDILSRYHLPEQYVLFSFSDWHNNEEYIQSLAQEIKSRGYEPVALPMPEKLFAAGIENQIPLPLSPIDWYALLKYSMGYIGERMHPIVVCLHNAVPFFSFDEYGTYAMQGFFKKRKVYQPLSSKTYQIVADAGLLSNLHSYKGEAALPTAQEVVDKLLGFDLDKCQAFAQRKQSEYERGIQEIVKSLSK